MFTVNLGGEGEVPGSLNQQSGWVLTPAWLSSQGGQSLADLVTAGATFVICPNDAIALPDGCVDRVDTNSVPIDMRTWLGVGVQSSEIRRIPKAGGQWFRDGVLAWTKP